MSTPPVSPDLWNSSRRWATIALRCGILLVVAIAVGHRIWLEKEKLANYKLSLAPAWLYASAASYLLGLATCAVFWGLAMRDMGGQPTWMSILAAYYAGHLGKYVPGKGLVLVIRATMVHGPNVGMAMAAVTAAQETALMMATGSLVAAAIFAVRDAPHRFYLLLTTGGLATVLGLLALPPVISYMWRIGKRQFPKLVGPVDSPCRWPTFLVGVGMIAVGWLLMGLSLAAVLAAMHEPASVVERRLLLTALVATATVGGFVGLTPGGLGWREWILIETLGPLVGTDHAVVCAGLLRLVWIAAELAAAGVLWMLERDRMKITFTI